MGITDDFELEYDSKIRKVDMSDWSYLKMVFDIDLYYMFKDPNEENETR